MQKQPNTPRSLTRLERKQRALAIAWDKVNPYMQKEGRPYHWQLGDVRVLERDSPEGQAELRRRAERKAARPIADGDLAGLL